MLTRKYLVFLIALFLAFISFSVTTHVPKEILIFYHIPKCGGTTIAALIGQHFNTEEIFHKIIQKHRAFGVDGLGPLALKGTHLIPLDMIDLEKVKYIHGHISFSKEKVPPGAKNITFLRDPVERVFSAYRYANEKVKLTFFDHYKQIANLQVFRLTSLNREDPNILLSEHLESAKKTLAHEFFFVGIVEEMDASIHTLYKLMNWEQPDLIPKFNITKKTEPNPELYEYVYNQEWADRELYKYGKLLLQQHKAKALNKHFHALDLDYVDSIHLTTHSSIDGEGWGYREFDLETDTHLRQSYIKDAFIQVPILKKNYLLKIKATFPTSEIAKNFQLLVNGHPIKWEQSETQKWKTFTANISKKLITKEKTKITFHVSDLYIPSEHGDAVDHRKMGIGISQVDITPR